MKEAGSAFIEVIVIVAIISVIAAAAVPKGGCLDRLVAQYEMIHLVNDIRYMQVLSHNADGSKNRSGPYDTQHPVLHINGDSYDIAQDLTHVYCYKLTGGTYLRANRDKYHFNLTGTLAAGSIYVCKNGKTYFRIVIDSVGRVRVEKL